MRLAAPLAALVAATTTLGACGGGSNGDSAKIGQAVAFATVAAIAQVAAQSSAALRVTAQCDNEDQYACISIAAGAAKPPDLPDHEMTVDEAHEYLLGYVNGIRKLSHLAPMVRDPKLDAFALAGSFELAQDHRQNQHIIDHAGDLGGRSTELQGSPDGINPGPLEDQIGSTLVRWVAEGAGGMHHDALVNPEWRKLGAGIVSVEGRTFFTIDFASE